MGIPEHEPVQSPQDSTRRSFLFGRRSPNPPSHEPELPLSQILSAPVKRRNLLRVSAAGVITTAVVTPEVVDGIINQYDLIKLSSDIMSKRCDESDIPRATTDTKDQEQKQFMELAMQRYVTMKLNFGIKNHLFSETSGSKTYAGAWAHGRADEATYAFSLLGLNKQFEQSYLQSLEAADNYWNTRPKWPGYDPILTIYSNNFFHKPWESEGKKIKRNTDDNLWLALSLSREYKRSQRKNIWTHERAKQVFQTVKAQEASEGGIYWMVQFSGETNRDRGIVSNATAVMLAVELYKEDRKNSEYLAFGEKIMGWMESTLQTDNGLYADSTKQVFDKSDKERVEQRNDKIWTYTQGVVIGALVKLSEVATNRLYREERLVQARNLAERSLEYFKDKGDGPDFQGIYFQNLINLAGVLNDEEFSKKVQSTLREKVKKLRDGYHTLLDQAGAVHMSALASLDYKNYHNTLLY